jgi:hypothetical protein
MESPNTNALSRQWQELGVEKPDLVRAFRGFNAWADVFRKESESHE